MASPPLLDFDALLAPVPGDSPAGAPLPYDVRLKLEDLRKEINPDDYDADDPRRPSQYRAPDWAAIVKLTTETLSNGSKDLLAAARLVEALTKEHGIPGLRDGLDLLARLADQGWDRVHPMLEPGESPEPREGPFKWLNQSGYGSHFPHELRQIPLLVVKGKAFNFEDWQKPDRRPAFESAISAATPEACQNLVDDLKSAKEKLQTLANTLSAKMGEFAPDLVSSEGSEHLGAAVNDCLKVAQQIMQRKTGAPAGQAGAAGTTGGTMVSQSLSTRADAYRMLNDAADLLAQLEPHSPVPLLVKRAVKLGDLKFPDLMKALIRENATIDELNRLMGLEAPPPPAA